jgi:ribosomal protein S2
MSCKIGRTSNPICERCLNKDKAAPHILCDYEVVIDASKEVGLEVNAEKTKYMLCLVTRMQGKIMTKIANRCFENVTQFRYLGTTITNQNLIQEELRGD